MDLGRHYLDDVISQVETQKNLADRAISQVTDEELFRSIDEESNSIAIVMRHVAGNLRSRFTDFLTTDGEKPDRHRDGEFELPAGATRDAIIADWDSGFTRLLVTLHELRPEDLLRDIATAATHWRFPIADCRFTDWRLTIVDHCRSSIFNLHSSIFNRRR